MAKQFAKAGEIREIKESERQSGDYFGSYQKEIDKIKRIEKSSAPQDVKDREIAKTKAHYARSREIAEEQLRKEEERITKQEPKSDAQARLKHARMKILHLTEEQYDYVDKWARLHEEPWMRQYKYFERFARDDRGISVQQFLGMAVAEDKQRSKRH